MTRLVTYSTPAYFLRSKILHASALGSGCVQSVASWSPKRLKKQGFKEICPNIDLSARGGGWYAWKPFVILRELEDMKDGDFLLYCDVGRVYPWKLIDRQLTPLILWMDDHKQFCVPGVEIPWHGPMSRWTKRDAFVLTDCDSEKYYNATQVQASFSLWRVNAASRRFVTQWVQWCSDRRLVSDDPNTCGKDNFSNFKEHRWDQSLLSLLCLRDGVAAISIGSKKPSFEEKNPSSVAEYMGAPKCISFSLCCLKMLVRMIEGLEGASRPVYSALTGKTLLRRAK